MTKSVLVVDDDPDIRMLVEAALSVEGYTVSTAPDGETAISMFTQNPPSLVVLDVMLPGMSGTEVCQKIRSASETPIIFLSGRGEDIDRIIGLELGADDYLPKPFNPRELVARVRAVLRRTEAQTEATDDGALVCGQLKLDVDQFQTYWGETEIELTKTEFLLLKTMIRHPGRVYSRSELMRGAYDGDVYVSDRTIDSHIRRLRNKLQDQGADPIKTVRGVGYKIEA